MDRLEPLLAHVNFWEEREISLIPISTIQKLNPLLVLELNEGPCLSLLLRMDLKSPAINHETSITDLMSRISSQKAFLELITSGAINTGKCLEKAI
jgi:hypothetical protein